LSKGVKEKPSGAEHRKRRAEKKLEFEESKKSMNLQKYFVSKSTENKTCNKDKASASASTLTTLLGVTNADDCHDVEEVLGSQSDFTKVVDNTQTPQATMINYLIQFYGLKFVIEK
jgi:hypothetical protein